MLTPELQPWQEGPVGLLRFARNTSRSADQLHQLIAFLILDICVETTMRTFLSLPDDIAPAKIKYFERRKFSEGTFHHLTRGLEAACATPLVPTDLVAVMDWASRKVLAWRLSNTLEASFCVAALQEALEGYGPPEIFNSDQGSHFTSVDFTDVLKVAGVRISMDGKGRWMDNVFIERLWRSFKYECVYLSEFTTGPEARTGIGGWMDFYNRCRPHSSLNGRTPEEAYTSP